MAFNIQEIRSQLVGGGARPSHFRVQITNPVNPFADFKIPFMCRAASIPASTITSIPVPYFGRNVKIAGEREFAPWTVTIINDEDFGVRNAMEEWMNSINTHVSNLRLNGASDLTYKADAIVTQYGKTGNILRKYKMQGLYPTNIGEITLDWGTTGQIEEFQVTFDYDWWTIAPGGITGSANIQ